LALLEIFHVGVELGSIATISMTSAVVPPFGPDQVACPKRETGAGLPASPKPNWRQGERSPWRFFESQMVHCKLRASNDDVVAMRGFCEGEILP